MDVNNGIGRSVGRSVETTPEYESRTRAETWHVASPHRVTSLAHQIAP